MHEPIVVSHENCHPWTYKNYTFMHNGGVPGFNKIRLKVLNLLSERSFNLVKGTTDSEAIFALFLDALLPLSTDDDGDSIHRNAKNHSDTINCEGAHSSSSTSHILKKSKDDVYSGTADVFHTAEQMTVAIEKAIAVILHLVAEAGIVEPCSLNLCVSNGVHIVVTRFRNSPFEPPPSLYYYCASKFISRDGMFYAEDESSASEIVISSAPLSKVCSFLDEHSSPSADMGVNRVASSDSAPPALHSAAVTCAASVRHTFPTGTALQQLGSSAQAQLGMLSRPISSVNLPGQEMSSVGELGRMEVSQETKQQPQQYLLYDPGASASSNKVEGAIIQQINAAISTASFTLEDAQQPSEGKDVQGVGGGGGSIGRTGSAASVPGCFGRAHCSDELLDPDNLFEAQDIGSWILIPKNHVLIVRGDPKRPHTVASLALEPIHLPEVSNPIPRPLNKLTRRFSDAFTKDEDEGYQPGRGTDTANDSSGYGISSSNGIINGDALDGSMGKNRWVASSSPTGTMRKPMKLRFRARGIEGKDLLVPPPPTADPSSSASPLR